MGRAMLLDTSQIIDSIKYATHKSELRHPLRINHLCIDYMNVLNVISSSLTLLKYR